MAATPQHNTGISGSTSYGGSGRPHSSSAACAGCDHQYSSRHEVFAGNEHSRQQAGATRLPLQAAIAGHFTPQTAAAHAAVSPASSRASRLCPILFAECAHASWQAPASTGGRPVAAASDEETVGFRQPLVLSIMQWLSWFACSQHHRLSHVFLRTLPERTDSAHVAAASSCSSSSGSSSSSSSFHSSTVVGPYPVLAVFCDVVSVCMI